MPQLSIIIINWNSKSFLSKCLASIAFHEKNLDYEVLVFDNNSNDDFDDLRGKFASNCCFVKLPMNIGFGRACNAAVAQANGEYLLFLGPDTEILYDNDIYRLLRKYMENPKWGALGCQFVGKEGDRQYSSIQFPSPANIIQGWWKENTNNIRAVAYKIVRRERRPSTKDIEVCDAVLGHCLMVSKAKFDEIGGFPSDVFLFSEDIEFCKKLILAGYINVKNNRCEIIHHQHKSIREKYGWNFIYLVQESLVRFNVKYHGRFYSAIAALLTVFRALWSLMFLWVFSIHRGPVEMTIRNWKILEYYLWVQFRKRAAQ